MSHHKAPTAFKTTHVHSQFGRPSVGTLAWRTLHLYPGDDPTAMIPRIPRAHTHGAFLHHPHPDHLCACEWDDTWRMVWAPANEPRALPVTALRHPAALTTAVSIPNPDRGAPAFWAARRTEIGRAHV